MSQHEYPHRDRYRNICKFIVEFKHKSDGTLIMTMTEAEYTVQRFWMLDQLDEESRR